MKIKEFYDKDTATISYVVIDEKTQKAAIIDSLLDYDQFSGKISTKSADILIDYVKENNFEIEWILETHIHADHLTASHYLKQKFPSAKTGIGSKIVNVLAYWTKIFNISKSEVPLDGSQFDEIFDDGQKFKIGELEVKVIHAPGHTPACVCYLIGDAIFVGDVIFMPDVGTARTDFPDGSAQESFDSLQKIFALPDEVKIYTAHDYPPQNREFACVSTVAQQKNGNVMINPQTTKENYVARRQARDASLAVPKLLLPSIQFNIRAGKMPMSEENGVSYIKIPLS